MARGDSCARLIGKREKALLHVARQQLGLSEEAYRDMLASVGCRSSVELDAGRFDEIMRRLEAGGFRRKRRHSSAPASGMDRSSTPEREPLLSRIGAELTIQKLPWSYADAIAGQMYGIRFVRWCEPMQLRAVVTALIKRKRKCDGLTIQDRQDT